MTDWTPHNNRIQTMHLTIIDNGRYGYAVKSNGALLKMFSTVQEAAEYFASLAYSAKPAPVTQDVVPWDAIDARWQWYARDRNGSVYFYIAEPKVRANVWASDSASEWSDGILAITPGTCDWRDSLQQRPQPAAMDAVTEPLKHREKYWLAAPFSQRWAIDVYWTGDGDDMHRLNTGQIHLTEASAVAHAKRMTGEV